MCQPISACSDGKGNIYAFSWEERKRIYEGDLVGKSYDCDSHTSIADFYGFKGEKEDRLNKWEFNFETGEIIADQVNTTNDLKEVLTWLKKVGPNYFYPPKEVAKVTTINGNLSLIDFPGLNWESLTEVKGHVRATNCQFPVLTEVKGDVRATNCQFPVLTEVKGDVRATNCQFPVLTEVKGHVWATNCQFPVLTEVKGHVRDCKDCQFPVLTEVKGHVWATNCQFPVLTEVKGHVWDCKDCQFPVLKMVNGKPFKG